MNGCGRDLLRRVGNLKVKSISGALRLSRMEPERGYKHKRKKKEKKEKKKKKKHD
jgi:hypothetical protein